MIPHEDKVDVISPINILFCYVTIMSLGEREGCGQHVLTILKNISQWEGLSDIMESNFMFKTTNQMCSFITSFSNEWPKMAMDSLNEFTGPLLL